MSRKLGKIHTISVYYETHQKHSEKEVERNRSVHFYIKINSLHRNNCETDLCTITLILKLVQKKIRMSFHCI